MSRALEGLATQVATRPRSLMRRLEIGLIAATAGILVRLAMDPLLGDRLPFSIFFPALLLAGVFGGLSGGLLALAVTAAGGVYLFLPERMSWSVAPGRESQIPVYLLAGGLILFVAVVLRGALIRLEAHRRRHEALVGELNNRLAKDLAVVASIANQTLRAAPEPLQFRHAFVDRLAILRDTHDALWSQDWRATSLRGIVTRPLRMFAPSEAERFLVEGPDVLIHPDLAINLALGVWELAAHAVRHGGLSRPEGLVRVEWARSGARVDLVWTETGGPSRNEAGPGPSLVDHGHGEALSWRSEWLPGLVRWSVAFASDGSSLPAPATAAAAPSRYLPARRAARAR